MKDFLLQTQGIAEGFEALWLVHNTVLAQGAVKVTDQESDGVHQQD